jgi:Cu/Ag efflux protein CusF
MDAIIKATASVRNTEAELARDIHAVRRKETMTKGICLISLALALLGCSARDTAKRYPMQGEVRALDPAAKTATISAGKIGDWMEPMTMEYPVKPDSELAKLHVGDHLEAVVVVEGEKYYVTGVRVVSKP